MKVSEIRQYVEKPLIDDALRSALDSEGFESLMDAAQALEDGRLPASLRPYRQKIRSESRKIRARLRDILVVHDPAQRALRHALPPDPAQSSLVVDEDEYCDPTSLQSLLSPARYLTEIYRAACARITPSRPDYALTVRRPDLASLELSDDHFSSELSTLSLANEVMTQYALKQPGNSTENKLYETLAELSRPFSLPFDRHHALARQGLAAMKTDLNALARNLAASIYALDQYAYLLTPNLVDKLGLYHKHLSILTGPPPTDHVIPSEVDSFLRYSTCTYEQLTALLCDVRIRDERGRLLTPDQTLASYINARTAPHLRCAARPGRVKITVSGTNRVWGVSTSGNPVKKRVATAGDGTFVAKEFVLEYLAGGSFHIRLAESGNEYVAVLDGGTSDHYELRAGKNNAVAFVWDNGRLRDNRNAQTLYEGAPVAGSFNERYIVRSATVPATNFSFEVLQPSTLLLIARSGTQPSQEDLLRMTHLIRLQAATGIAFTDLNQLLALGGEIYKKSAPVIDEFTLKLVARYVEWRERFGLSVDDYGALIGRVNEYWRENHQELSFLRQLFGQQAKWISEYTAPDSTKLLKDLSAEQVGWLQHGLKLTEEEWETIVGYVDAGRTRRFDAACLSALYRFARLFPMLGWGVSGGIALVAAISHARPIGESLLTELAGPPSDRLLSLLDQLAWLAEMLSAMRLTAQQAYAILRVVDSSDVINSLHATQAMVNRVNGLYQDIKPALLTQESFSAFASVPKDPALRITVSGATRAWGLSTAWKPERRRLATAADSGFMAKEFLFEYLADGSFHIRLADGSGEYVVPLIEITTLYELRADLSNAVAFRWEDGRIRDLRNNQTLYEEVPFAPHANSRYINCGSTAPATLFVADVSKQAGTVMVDWRAELQQRGLVDADGLIRNHDEKAIREMVAAILAAHQATQAAAIQSGVCELLLSTQNKARYTVSEALSEGIEVSSGSVLPMFAWMNRHSLTIPSPSGQRERPAMALPIRTTTAPAVPERCMCSAAVAASGGSRPISRHPMPEAMTTSATPSP